MNIQYNNIGTEFERFEIYLREEDYHKLFTEESFGKLLILFEDLGKMISGNPEKLKEWTSGCTRYDGVLEVSKEICKICGSNETSLLS
jgi:hypothetical protein